MPRYKSGYGKGRESFLSSQHHLIRSCCSSGTRIFLEVCDRLKQKMKYVRDISSSGLFRISSEANHKENVLLDKKKVLWCTSRGSSFYYFRGKPGATHWCSMLLQDVNSERRKDSNLSTTAHTAGAFPYSGTCRNGNSQPWLQEDNFPQFTARSLQESVQ